MADRRPLKSERVVVAAPMSFAGAFGRLHVLGKRILALQIFDHPAIRIPVAILVVATLGALLVAWWFVILAWYLLWGLLLVPYRLIRRGSRKRKITARQHRETLGALKQHKQ